MQPLQEEKPERGFTGFFIRAEWIDDKRLNQTDWLLLAEIEALSKNKKSRYPGWCYATNAYLSSFVGRHEVWVSKRCSFLREIGLIEQDFNGQQMLRRLKDRLSVDANPQSSALASTLTQGKPVRQPCLSVEANPALYRQNRNEIRTLVPPFNGTHRVPGNVEELFLDLPETFDAEELMQIAIKRLEEAGYTVTREYPVKDRGDGVSGRIDLVASKNGTIEIAIEGDSQTPREKSIFKLNQMNCKKVILLRSYYPSKNENGIMIFSPHPKIECLPIQIQRILMEEGVDKNTIAWLGKNKTFIQELARTFKYFANISRVFSSFAKVYALDPEGIDNGKKEIMAAATHWDKIKKASPAHVSEKLDRYGLPGWIESGCWVYAFDWLEKREKTLKALLAEYHQDFSFVGIERKKEVETKLQKYIRENYTAAEINALNFPEPEKQILCISA